MTNILYTYNNQVYANITNRCDCHCQFCIRSHKDKVGEAENLWFQKEPTLEEIKKAIDDFDFSGFEELVFCGYGEQKRSGSCPAHLYLRRAQCLGKRRKCHRAGH